ncbi:hypothetical protein [Methylobacterium nodulans]|uniref:Uncharacterized protein n=1 Tax=Methylobacterium nodulans (strain LMG 21967 / CNCM I-2342 / ORS 2060) TaxID=460265 RepID=B8IAM9_METNO|nr:hypothetical protein [Methylobacterium nodulans]ACL61074.1 conserved hypothetical protein [Methylobacterium nodulans ORS 2060]
MARIRTIKPEFWSSAQVMDLSVPARLLFIGIWNFCDDHGRAVFSARRLKAQIFPSDDFTAADVHGMLTELMSSGLIKIYVIEDREFFEVTGWHHQHVNRRGNPIFPLPPWALEKSHSLNEKRKEKEKEKEILIGGGIAPPKRPRGRPRKHPRVEPAAAAPAAQPLNGAHHPAASAGRDEEAVAATAADRQPGPTVPSHAEGKDSGQAPEQPARLAIEHTQAFYDRVLARLHEAIPGAPVDPAVGPMVRLLAQGMDLETDLIPACLDALAGKKIYTWEILAQRILERRERAAALRERQGLPAQPRANQGPKHEIPGAGEYSAAFLQDCVKRWRQDPSSWFPFLGPKPDEPGCHIPRHLIETARKAA